MESVADSEKWPQPLGIYFLGTALCKSTRRAGKNLDLPNVQMSGSIDSIRRTASEILEALFQHDRIL